MSATAAASLAERAGAEFAAYQAGDEQRLGTLVDLLTPVLWHLARGAGLDRDSAEDVVQTGWLKLVEHVDEIRDPRTVLAWLGTTVRREAWRRRDDRRAVPASDALPGLERPAADEPVDEMVVNREEHRVLLRHFAALSPRCQQILRVICCGGPPDYAALSEALGIPVGSIGPTRGRCLATLRKALLAEPTWSVS